METIAAETESVTIANEEVAGFVVSHGATSGTPDSLTGIAYVWIHAGVEAHGASDSGRALYNDDVLRIERTLQRRVLRLFQRRGLLDEYTVEDMLTWQASGGFSPRPPPPLPRRPCTERSHREQVIHLGRDDAAAPGSSTDSLAAGQPGHAGTARNADAADLPDSPQRAAARSRWARLLARISEVFPFTCAGCGGDMRILAFITAAEPTDAILTHSVNSNM